MRKKHIEKADISKLHYKQNKGIFTKAFTISGGCANRDKTLRINVQKK